MDVIEGAAMIGAAVAAVVAGRWVLERRRGSSEGVGRSIADQGEKLAGSIGHAIGSAGHSASSAAERAVTTAGRLAASGAGAAIDAPAAAIDRLRHHERADGEPVEPEQPSE